MPDQFYERFREEHAALCTQINGLAEAELRRRYATLLLSRLMGLRFLQQGGLLDGDRGYLRHRLEQSRAHAPDRYFADGLVPLFSNGLFCPLPFEVDHCSRISLPDAAFVRLYNFFDQYEWRLDEGSHWSPGVVTPAILGAIFEQQLNQKQLGAYYTRDDISTYIAQATMIPALLDALLARFPELAAHIAALLAADPARYLPAALAHGSILPLPAPVAEGLDDPGRRATWARRAPPEYALPGEIWREVVARRKRYTALHTQLAGGTLSEPNALVSANLELGRLALDLIRSCKRTELLCAWWEELTSLTVLDPTCGAGAFLIAALRILEPLYAACLGSGSRFSILQTIIANNLYGVDMMEEAVEICRLRLVLMLAAASDGSPQLATLTEAVKNLRAGNALVGDVGADPAPVDREKEKFGEGEPSPSRPVPHEDAELFREGGSSPARPAEDARVSARRDGLDRRLAREYGVDPDDEVAFVRWREGHRPFHWGTEFAGVLRRGGFDVVIGNPPYLGYSKVRPHYTVRGYSTEGCGNLYALTVERALALLREGGRCGVIVPTASVSTAGMAALQQLYAPLAQWHSHYAVRPARLFAGVDMNMTISLLHKVTQPELSYTSGYRRWSENPRGERTHLFATLAYVRNPRLVAHASPYPRLGSALEVGLLLRMHSHERKLRAYTEPGGVTLYYHSGGRYWRKALPQRLSSHYHPISVQREVAPHVFALLNSQLFYWYWISNSNCMDLVSREVLELPVFVLEQAPAAPFVELMEQLLAAYADVATTRIRRGSRINVAETNFNMQCARPVIDAIDRLLALHYGMDAEELDFVLHYDGKYR